MYYCRNFIVFHSDHILKSYTGMNPLLGIPQSVTKVDRCHWMVGPGFKLLMQSMTAIMTPDHLTLHFPNGSWIPAVTLTVDVKL